MTETKQPADELAIGNAEARVSSNSTTQTTEIQRHLIINRLQIDGSITTLACRALGIMSPAPRILELRRRGHHILTSWRTETDHAGIVHKQARYVLMPSDGEVAK